MVTNHYQLNIETVLQIFHTNPKNGLNTEEVDKRLQHYGKNQFVKGKPTSLLELFLGQFKSILIIILIFAGIVSFLMGDKIEGYAILFVVLLNAVLGFVQEYKADKSVKAIQSLVSPIAKVIRNGSREDIPQENLVPGDIVILESGDKIPGDMQIIESFRLKIDESMLTGESVTVSKSYEPMIEEQHSIGDIHNMVYMGTIVVDGRGKAVVVQTGTKTELGKIADLTENVKVEKTPLEKKLDVFSKNLTIILGLVCGVIFTINLIRPGSSLQDTFIFAVSLAVAAIPESLPAVTTIVLSSGVSRMSKRKAVVKRLSSVETLGSTTVICTDKTGTLTENKMKVEFVYTNGLTYSTKDLLPDKPELDMIQNICYFNNDSYIENGKEFGDPTEIALLNIALDKEKKYKEIRFNRHDEIPFDSTRKMMSTLHRISDKPFFFTKGAFEEVIKRCQFVYDGDKIVSISPTEKEKYENVVTEWSKNGYRVLALAYKEDIKEVSEEKLIMAGLVAMRDPIRPEVFSAIQKCKDAGIRVIMMTGDHLETAKAYARELNMASPDDSAYNHQDMEAMTEDELSEALQTTTVFARITPEDKYRVVEALKNDGEIVAMTGDGVNDAPALRKADIGIAMGIRGTDLTKEVASLVLLDDNFATIVNAIEEGRVIYDNIKNTIFFLLSCNLGEILLVICAIVLNMKMPMGPLHLLWLNLITDSFPALALGFEKAGKDVMKPRNDTKNNFLTRSFLSGIMFQALFIGGGSFFLFYRHYSAGILEATTVCFTGLIMIELFRALSTRNQNQTILKIGIFSNPYMVYSLILSFGFLLLALYGPIAFLFNSIFLSPGQWLEIIVTSIVVLFFAEGRKLLYKVTS